MLKKLILLSLFMLVLVACSAEYEDFAFEGESENWEGVYTGSVNINEHKEEGKYIFTFKNGPEEIEFKNLEVDVGKMKITGDTHYGNTVEFSCKDCEVSPEEGIKATIKWDDGNEETVLLKKKR